MSENMSSVPFVKMQGTGNDFVIIEDWKNEYHGLDYRRMADRKFGIGCDQVVVLTDCRDANCIVRFINADGSEAETCGNALRCVVHLLSSKPNASSTIRMKLTDGKIVEGICSFGKAEVKMGSPQLISPMLSMNISPTSTYAKLPLTFGPLQGPCVVNMGNPHVVFFADQIDAAAFATQAAIIEMHPSFPHRTNVSIAHIGVEIEALVWERGVGLTLACGSAACAILYAAMHNGYSAHEGVVAFPGGRINVRFESGELYISGETARVFDGTYYDKSVKDCHT